MGGLVIPQSGIMRNAHMRTLLLLILIVLLIP
jgi:hypothetical protein